MTINKMRVHELSKELGVQIKELMNYLNELGANVRNHMSTIEDKFVDQARQTFPAGEKKPRVGVASATATGTAAAMPKAETPATVQVKAPTGAVSKDEVRQPVKSAGVAPKQGVPGVQSTAERPQPVKPVQRQPAPTTTGAAQPGTATMPEVEKKINRPQPQPNQQPRPYGAGQQPGKGPGIDAPKPAVEEPNRSQPQATGTRPQAAGTQQPRPATAGRPQGGEQRPDNNRPQGAAGNNRPQGAANNRPQGGEQRWDNNRPQGAAGNNRPQGAANNRPQGAAGNNRPQGAANNRPQGGEQRWDNNRPQGAAGNNRPQGAANNRPQGAAGNNRPQGAGNNRPQGGEQRRDNNRPQGGANNRPQGGEQRRDNNRPGGANNRPQGGNNNRQQSGYNQRGTHARPPQRPMVQKPKGPATNVKSVQLPAHMTVKDFAQLLELAAGEIIKKLMGLGLMATINQEVDLDTMVLIADEYGITATAAQTEEEKLQVEEIEDDPASLVKRSPVVTIMGHVDHGKTSLLDAIREANVTASEAGGITQHIGAYQVELNERKITFLDTPGHAAFTAMRARGAQVTDIAILVVAADDGVMPQTVEAINHAKDANVSIIVAVNKIDKPGANIDRIKQEMTEHGLVAEEWGGDTIFAPVSAKQRIGIESLLEMILLVADMKELKANPNRAAKGTIIEAELDKGRGPVATVLVQNGTLELGDSIIAGAAFGKVRALINDKGKRVKKAGPSTPVEVIGFDELPEAGDIMHVITEERMARQLADKRMQLKRENELLQNQKVTLNDLFTKIKEGAIKELKLIIKADVQGSVEAIRQSLERLSNDEVKVKVIHGGVGAIGEGDVTFASAANAIIIGFNVRPDPNAKRMAEKDNVDIQLYRVIYNIIEDVQKAMEGMLDPEYKEVVTARLEVRAVYKVPKIGNIAGCYVTEGKINRNHEIRLLRDNIVIHEGKIDSLKRFKDDVRDVAEGYECGMGVANFNDIKEGDTIEAFMMEEIKRTKD